VSRVGVAVGGLTVAAALVAGGIMVGQRGVTPPAAPRPVAVVTTAAKPPAARPLHSVVTVDPSVFDPPPTHTPIGLIAWTILALVGFGVAVMLWRMWARDRAADRAEPEPSTFVSWMAPARTDITPVTHELPAAGGAFAAPRAAGRMPAWMLAADPDAGPRRPAATMNDSTTVTISPTGGYHRTR